MLKKTVAPVLTILLLMMFLLSFGSLASNDFAETNTQNQNATTSKLNCSKMPDADIVKAIKEQFQADADISANMNHLNVSVKNRAVKLEGWIGENALILKAISIAKKTQCVKKVTSKLKESGHGTCGPGLKPCGETCIDKTSDCNIGN